MKAYLAKQIVTGGSLTGPACLLVDGGRVAGIAPAPPAGAAVTDYAGCVLAPGFIDIHTHGALGYEVGFGDEAGLQRWAAFQLRHGVTGFLPSAAAIPLDRMREAAAQVRAAMQAPAANILGLHLEGPFYAKTEKIGAQNPDHIRAELTGEYRDFLQTNRDLIRYIAVDPALPAAEEIVRFCAGLGFRVSAAHTCIAYEDFRERKAWGFRAITHSFNGMSGLDHRRPGLAYAACLDQDLYSEIICDGHHVNYLMLRLLLRLKERVKTVLITDAMAATGLPPGSFSLGGLAVQVSPEGKVTKPDGGLAGSTLTLDRAVRNAVRMLDLTLAEAVSMASTAPAALLGLADKGSLAPGKDADFVVLDPELNVIATYLRGDEVFAERAGASS